ncbi:unnamed protein product, partial [Choristocarpus tenellus]
LLLLESGVRFHTTKFTHDKADMPSGFSMKLRKHIRSKRLEDVRQIGMDRVVDFKFGSGETCNHVILELYASGNIILTDQKYEILNLLRTHTYDGDVSVAVRQIYPIDLATSQEGVVTASTSASATTAVVGEGDGTGKGGEKEGEAVGAFLRGLSTEESAKRVARWLESGASDALAGSQGQDGAMSGAGGDGGGAMGGNSKAKKAADKKAKKATLKQLLLRKGSGVSVYGPSIIDHCILAAGLRPNSRLALGVPAGGLSQSEVKALVIALEEAEVVVGQLDRPGQEGYILCKGIVPPSSGTVAGGKAGTGVEGGNAGGNGEKLSANKVEEKEDDGGVVYDEFLPQVLEQHQGGLVHKFASFDQAVDSFFGRIVEQKLKQAAASAEAASLKKVNKIREGLENRTQELEQQQDKMLRHAQLAESYADDVEK